MEIVQLVTIDISGGLRIWFDFDIHRDGFGLIGCIVDSAAAWPPGSPAQIVDAVVKSPVIYLVVRRTKGTVL